MIYPLLNRPLLLSPLVLFWRGVWEQMNQRLRYPVPKGHSKSAKLTATLDSQLVELQKKGKV